MMGVMGNDLPTDVRATFDSYPAPVRRRLLELRELILSTAAETPGVGPLEETLKWGEPSFLTSETRSGTTVRIAPVRDEADKFALYVNCQTSLIETLRARHPDLDYRGTRAVAFSVDEPLPAAARDCVAAALTYHRAKKTRRR